MKHPSEATIWEMWKDMGEGPRDHLEYRWSRDYNLGKKWSKDKLECEIIEYYEAEYDEVQEASAIDLALADRLGK